MPSSSAIVSGNSAGVGDGGGIAVVGRVSVIGTAEVRGNTSAGRGGGVWLKGPSGELDLLSSALIVQNQGFGGGGGLGYESSTTPSLGPCGIAIAGNSPNNCESF